ncbi:hypothetical protein [Cryptosporangium minutisporangium]|uniref:Uncharacterized protein n=2 Tax=Cryptosporangium minutisporangium TaxID=113569 RepID=A0ABP6T7L3_9ACTN
MISAGLVAGAATAASAVPNNPSGDIDVDVEQDYGFNIKDVKQEQEMTVTSKNEWGDFDSEVKQYGKSPFNVSGNNSFRTETYGQQAQNVGHVFERSPFGNTRVRR